MYPNKMGKVKINDADCKQCTKCKTVKRLTEYRKDVSKKDGRKAQCKDCQAVRTNDKCERLPGTSRVHNKTFTEVIIEMEQLLNEGNVVSLNGLIKLNDKDEFEEYRSRGQFFNIKQLHSYTASMEQSSDMDEMYFTGNISYEVDPLKRVVRSKKGDGTTFLHTINEYEGKHCYIPSENQCFIKCYNWLTNQNNSEIYNEFVYREHGDASKQVNPFIMSNAKFERFNNYFNDSVQIIIPPIDIRILKPQCLCINMYIIFIIHPIVALVIIV